MKPVKLLGLELCRGLSTYAVIFVHSGDETWQLPIASSAIMLRLLFYFAVPFFLATAFYFMTTKFDISKSSKFWRSRLDRLIIPYVVWSIIFLIARAVLFVISKKTERLQQLLQDPLSIVFFGGASYHLYFLTLLLAGTSLILFTPLLQKWQVSKYGLILFSVLSVALYQLSESSGNSFQLGANIAFQNLLDVWQINVEHYPLLRLILVEIAWIIRCLPYFFIALTLNRLQQSMLGTYTSAIVPIGWGIAFLLVNILVRFQLEALREVFLGYTLLLFGISISRYLKADLLVKFSASVGTCSFGIYLIHPFVMNVVKLLIGKVLPEVTASISIFSMFALSIPCFTISWISVAYLNRNKAIAKYLFGV